MSKLVPVESIISKIVYLRREKVLLDRDLAEMYSVETKQLKRAVRRNISRFPEDFMFELSKEEYQLIRSQFGTFKRGTHSKYAPMAFTEQMISYPDKREQKIGYIKENQANYAKSSMKI